MNEMPAFNDKNASLGKKDGQGAITVDRYEHTKKVFKLDKVLKVGQFNYEIYKKEGLCRIFIKELAELVGFMGVQVDSIELNGNSIEAAQVVSVYIFEEYQGKGLGFDLYKILLNEYGTIMSDISLTGSNGGGSFHMWEKVSELEGISVYTYDIDDRVLVRVNKIERGMMGSEGVRFIASYKDLG